MGSDSAPASEVAGALDALDNGASDLTVVLVGDREQIQAELDLQGASATGRLEIVHAPERVSPNESPAAVVRRKPGSSIVTGIGLHRRGQVQAFVSAGPTGAVMAASVFVLKRLPGVDRPAVGTLLPTTSRAHLLMLDAGANVDCRPQHLLQFGYLGHVYAQDLMGRPDPRIGLLNIGSEPEKGDERTVEAYRLLRQSELNFIGNVEGRDIIRGSCDVLVTDGFAGNVLLKFYESVAGFVIRVLDREQDRIRTPLATSTIEILDYAEYGGAPLLGVNGVSVICHGRSPPKAIRKAVEVAAKAVRASMTGHIARYLAETAARIP
jgi:glycerol-3-phosphate acyltransferase PlsX